MVRYPPRCEYWHLYCKEFFQDFHPECDRDPNLCLIYWDFKEQEELQQEYEKKLLNNTE